MEKMVVLNIKPYYAGQGTLATLLLDVRAYGRASVKWMTALSVDEKGSAKVTWAVQSFRNGKAVGEVKVDVLGPNEKVAMRDSEGVLTLFK